MKKLITVFKGDGIGPEITDCVLEILEAAGADLAYEMFNVGAAEMEKNGALVSDEAYASFDKTVFCRLRQKRTWQKSIRKCLYYSE